MSQPTPSQATSSAQVASAATTMVLLASPDRQLSKRLDTFAGTMVDEIDLRGGSAWLHVADPDRFVAALANAFPEAEYDNIRIALVAPEATVDELVHRAMVASTLRQHLDALEDAAFKQTPPNFQVHYQPIVNLADSRVVGFEALLRASVNGVFVDTESVFERADRGGWIGELDQLARVLAIKGVGEWLDGGLLFLNLVAPDGAFDLAAIHSTIDAAIEAGLSPDQLVFEAVEHNRYHDISAATGQIAEIRARGVRIAVDDVGDGFASLRILTSFTPDIVKISGKLAADVAAPAVESTIATIVDLAHRMGAWVIAEGIENTDQAKRLTTLGCDWGQGQLLGGPAPARP